MNGANEVAVYAFLRERIGFNDIPALVQAALDETPQVSNPALSDILEADRLARESVRARITATAFTFCSFPKQYFCSFQELFGKEYQSSTLL